MFGSGGGALPRKSDHNDGKIMAAMTDSADGSNMNHGTGTACCRLASQHSPKEIEVELTGRDNCDWD